MKETVDFIKGFDLHTIIVIAIAFWWLHGDIVEMKSEIQLVKTVLITKGIMPECFVKESKVEHNKATEK